MPAFVPDGAFRALDMLDRVPAEHVGVLVTRESFEPHLRHAEVAVVDTDDREPQHGELYAVAIGLAAARTLAIVQAYRRDGDLWCRYGFKVPGEAPPLSYGPFTPAGWAGKCVGRVVAAMRPMWQAADR